MAKNDDHTLSIGFQGKKALEGLKAIEDSLARIAKLQKKIGSTTLKVPKGLDPVVARQPMRPKVVPEEGSGKVARRPRPRRSGPTMRSRPIDTSGFERTMESKELSLKGVFNRTESKELKASIQSVIERIRALRMEASKTSDPKAIERLRNEYMRLGVVAREATRQVALNNKKLSAAKFASNSAARSIKNLAGAYISVFAVIEGFRGFLNLSKDISSLSASMLAASGTAEQAERDFGFIKDTANELGRDLKVTAKGFQQIATATRAAGMSQETTKEIFLAASEASTAFGLSVEDSAGVMRAFSQIASKGSVSYIAA